MRCIFCGRDAVMRNEVNKDNQERTDYFVECKSCLAKGPSFQDSTFAELTWVSITNIIKAHFDA